MFRNKKFIFHFQKKKSFHFSFSNFFFGMSTKDEELNLVPEGTKYCTRFRKKENTTSVYLNLTKNQPSNDVFFVKIVGRTGNNSEFQNLTYMTDSFPIMPGKKYLLYNLATPQTEVRLEFYGLSSNDLQGVWSPDSAPESGTITIGPEYKKKKGNTKDEAFSFTANSDGQEFTTSFRDKFTNSSLYLNLQQSNFHGTIECKVLGKSGNDVGNCTNRTTFYKIESGKKYEVYNTVHEDEYQLAALSFKLKQGDTVKGVWSPDYAPESGVIVIGGRSLKANTSDTAFDLTLNGPKRTDERMKMNSSSIYLKINSLSHPVNIKVFGTGGDKGTQNETNKQEFYTIDHPGKYELYNTVHENGHEAAFLEFEGPNDAHISGVWSPDYVYDPECITLGSSPASSTPSFKIDPVTDPIKFIKVPFISQQGIPTGCESVSATMALQYWGIDIRPYDFITRYLPKMPTCSYPDPNSYFVGNPYSKAAYGCFAPCLKTAISNVLSGLNYDVINTSGRDLDPLCHQFIDSGKPVIIWATMGMRPTKFGSSSWTIKTVNSDAKYKVGDHFQWPGNEHCLLLVGYSNDKYIVNDPLAGVGSYPKSLLQERFTEQGKQSVVITPKGTPVLNPQPFSVPPTPPPISKEKDPVNRVIDGVLGAVKFAGGMGQVVGGATIAAASSGIAVAPGVALAAFGTSNAIEGAKDILNAINGSNDPSINPIRDFLFMGNQTLYDAADIALSLGAEALTKSLTAINQPIAQFGKAQLLTDAEAAKITGGVPKAKEINGTISWDLNPKGSVIYGRYYTEHALQRMAPRTPEVFSYLRTRYLELHPYKGWALNSAEGKKWAAGLKKFIDPRNIPPMVVEDIIQHETRQINTVAVKKIVDGKKVIERVVTPDKFRYVRKISNKKSITVIVNEIGDVITVLV